MSNPFEVLEKRLGNIETILQNLQGALKPDVPTIPQYLYSIKSLSEFLGCSIPTAHKIKMSGRIRYKQIGRKLIFSCNEILEDLSKKQGKGGLPKC